MSDKPNWIADSLFNLLIDYYTEIPFRPYGSGATRENVLPVLRDLRLGYISIYAKGHSGRTTFPSRLKTEHEMLAQDMPAFWREVTRETDTRLVLYYSGLLDGLAGIANPDWCMRSVDGEPIRYFVDLASTFKVFGVCPLSEYFEQWASVHLEEMIGRYAPDGVWVDGDWAGPCYCPRCERRFRAESGYDGPLAEMGEAVKAAYGRFWSQVLHEWRMRFAARVKQLKGDCLYSAGNISPRREFNGPFDWRSGDYFSPNLHRLHISWGMRRYASLVGTPYDAFTCDTCFVHGNKEMRSRTKPLVRMLQEGATVLANGGLWSYWTYPMPHGAFVSSKMRQAKAAGRFARARREVCLGAEPVGWTAVRDAKPRPFLFGDDVSVGAAKALIALHRSPLFIDEDSLADEMPYDLIVLPEQPELPADAAAKLETFVRRGGKLLSTGDSIASAELQRLLGVRLAERGAVTDGHVLRRDGEPSGVYAPWDRLEFTEAEEMYPLLLSWDAGNPRADEIPANYPITGMVDEEAPAPAGMPAATIRRLGDGLAVHVPTRFFGVYWRFGNPDMLAWLREILGAMDPQPLLATDAPSFVEITLRRKGNALLVHFVNGCGGRDISCVGSEDYWVDDIPPVGPITTSIRCATQPTSARWEPGGEPAETTWADGTLTVTLERLAIHTCLVVDGWNRP